MAEEEAKRIEQMDPAGLGMDLVQFATGPCCRVRCGIGGAQLGRIFVTGQPARAFEGDLGRPTVDVLRYICMHVFMP